MKSLSVAVAGLSLFAGACGTKDAPGPLESGATGRVRFVNLINDPARNPVNVILESVPFGVGLTYTGSTPASLGAPSTAPYSAILTGNRTLVVKRTADTSATLATIDFMVVTGENYTIYATGGAAGGTVTSVVTSDVNTAPAATETRVRVANMSPTAGAVDVFVTAAGADLTGATPNATNVASGTASAYFSVAPASYTVRFVPAGTVAAARNGAVIFTVAASAFAGGSARTVVLVDRQQGGTPLQAFTLADR